MSPLRLFLLGVTIPRSPPPPVGAGARRIPRDADQRGETQDRLQQVGEELPIGTALALDYDDYLDAFERKPPPHADKPTLLVETSRGCWWGERSHCTFCGLNDLTLGYRAMGVEQATAQVQSLFRYVGRVERIMAVDVIIPKELLSEMLPRLATPPRRRCTNWRRHRPISRTPGTLPRKRRKPSRCSSPI